MAVPHNVTKQIPLTRLTDPTAFPPSEFQEYPKMLLRPATDADIKLWAQDNQVVDDRSGKVSYRPGRPRLGALIPIMGVDGQPLTVASAEEEEQFRRDNPEVMDASKGAPDPERARLEAEVAALRRQLAARDGGNGDAGQNGGGSADGGPSDVSGGKSPQETPQSAAGKLSAPKASEPAPSPLASLTLKPGQTSNRQDRSGGLPTRLPPGGSPAG
jgi:hypothetical protein